MKNLWIAVLIIAFSASCKREGCTDSKAINYDAKAKTDDGSCTYKLGCTDPLADNYDASAVKDDGSCSYQTKGFLKLRFVPRYQGIAFGLRDEYINWEGVKFEFSEVKFYASTIEAISNSGNHHSLSDVAFINFEVPSSMEYVYPLDPGSYSQLSFLLGLTPSQNASDPNSFEADHPLSVYSTMFWNVPLKYLFVKIEGIVDADANPADLETGFIFHLGLDSLLKPVDYLNNDFNISLGDTLDFPIYVDMEKFFFNSVDTIYFKTENNTQTVDNPMLASKAMRLFSKIFSGN